MPLSVDPNKQREVHLISDYKTPRKISNTKNRTRLK
jgi:hypothetical protein